MSSSCRSMRAQKRWRYESRSGGHDALQQLCSSDLANPEFVEPTLPSSSVDFSLQRSIHPCSISSTTTSHNPPLPPITTTVTPKRRGGSICSTELHQPIGFVCCYCRYHSSGSYCSNPDYAGCPHRTAPRCRNCPIIFTPPRLMLDIYRG
jgi:hypothetical protein